MPNCKKCGNYEHWGSINLAEMICQKCNRLAIDELGNQPLSISLPKWSYSVFVLFLIFIFSYSYNNQRRSEVITPKSSVAKYFIPSKNNSKKVTPCTSNEARSFVIKRASINGTVTSAEVSDLDNNKWGVTCVVNTRLGVKVFMNVVKCNNGSYELLSSNIL